MSVALLAHLIAIAGRNNYLFIMVTLLCVLLTPTQIELSGSEYAPALFNFFFNVFFEQDFSMRALRPLILSLPLCAILLLFWSIIKRRFF